MDEKLKENNDDYFKIKIEPLDDISLEHKKFQDWDFFWSSKKMLSGKELDMISDRLKVNRLPDMFFGYNRFFLIYSKADFMIEISPIEMVELTSYAERQSKYIEKEKIKNGLFNPDLDDPNFIYYMPPDVKVQYHYKWKTIKVDRDDIQTMIPVQDWTFTSSYIGNIFKLSNNKLIESKYFNDFDLTKKYSNPEIKNTEEALPIHMLGRDNPIVDYMEINLYEDELCDNGQTKSNFRFRIMNNCFLGLLRSYLRVDNVLVRILDTRIFHIFGKNYVYREFQVKENTYEELKSRGFKFTSDWSLSHNQSDTVSQMMDVVFTAKDKIIIDQEISN